MTMINPSSTGQQFQYFQNTLPLSHFQPDRRFDDEYTKEERSAFQLMGKKEQKKIVRVTTDKKRGEYVQQNSLNEFRAVVDSSMQ